MEPKDIAALTEEEVRQHNPNLVLLIERSADTLRLTVVDMVAAERAVPSAVAAQGLALRRLEADEVSLEEVFVELVGED